jgi:type I restriction enzyme S subunit
MKWKDCHIGDFVDAGLAEIQTGPFGTQLKASAYLAEGTPVINVRNIGFGNLRAEKLEHVGDHTTDKLGVHLLRENDIVFGRKGAVNRHLFVTKEQENWMQGSDCIRLRFSTDRVCPRFVSQAFLRKEHQQWMLMQSGNKATMASLNHDIIKRIPLRLPPVPTQERIVSTLSCYDDLIENNHRRMALSEKAALLLYREWFIRLRFPGHEHTRTIRARPQGWTTYALDDLCLIGRGASPRPIVDFMGGDVPWFKIGDATASETCYILHTAEHVTEAGAKKSISLEQGSLVLSNSATCGIPYFTGVKGCIHDGWLHFANLKRISQRFLYCYLHFKRDELVSSVSDGSTQKNLNTAAVGRLTVALPAHDSLLTQFEESVGPLFSMIYNLACQNNALRAARDLLLPRFMSGEIPV